MSSAVDVKRLAPSAWAFSESRLLRPGGPLPSLLGLVLFVALQPIDHVWLIAIILCGLLLALPGILLLRALGVASETLHRFPLYVPAAAIFVVSLSGMLADLAGPHIGIDLPLHGDTAELTTVGVCLILWGIGLRSQDDARLPWAAALTSLDLIAPLALPLLAAAGALLLTNGHGSQVASVAAVAMPAALCFCLLRANGLSRAQVAILLFACALAAEWAFSLRSQEIVGYDISTELGLAEHVHTAGIWHIDERGNAYGAMLSLTVFPAVLSQMVGVSPLIAFKVLYPIFTALLPVAIFLVAERFMQRRFAAAAASLLLVQYYFFQQLAEIARQEVGMLFFACLVAVLFDQDTRVSTRRWLAVMLGLGMVVSHYSSTYFGIIFLALSLPFYAIVARWRPRRTGLTGVLVLALIVTAGGAAFYYGPVTHSASNLGSFKKILSQDGFDLFPASSGNLVKSYLSENTTTTISGPRYEQLAAKSYDKAKFIHPLSQAFEARYRLQTATAPAPGDRFGALASAFGDFGAAFGELMLLVVGLGALWALIGKDKRLRAMGVFGLSMIAVLLVFRFSATLAQQYNQTRAELQALLILSIPAGLLADRVSAKLSRTVAFITITAIVLMFAVQDGSTWLLVRGGQPLNLANAGEAFERFYETPAELAGAAWTSNASHRQLVYADEYGGLRLEASAQLFPLETLTPETMDRRAWVYGTRTNVRLGRARASIESDYSVYDFPSKFLDNYYDTVFDDGDTKVWHR